MSFFLDKILSDEAGIEQARQEMRGRNRPEDLLERILSEVKVYKMSGLRGQYEGTYRGHRFIIGWEPQRLNSATREQLLAKHLLDIRPQRKIMVFCIANKPGGYPTEGLRFTDEIEGPHTYALHMLFETAERLYEEAEIERLMRAERNPSIDSSDKDFSTFFVTDPTTPQAKA